VVTFVLPLRTRGVLRIAMRNHVEAVGRLVDHSSGYLLGQDHDAGTTLRADARDVDASYQALVATAQPLRRSLFGSFDEDTGAAMRLAAASRYYSRNLVADVETVRCLDPDTRADIERATATLHDSLDVVTGALNGSRDATYTRSSALFDRAERRLEANAGVANSPFVISSSSTAPSPAWPRSWASSAPTSAPPRSERRSSRHRGGPDPQQIHHPSTHPRRNASRGPAGRPTARVTKAWRRIRA